jgi:hypothetical protein
VIHGSVLHVQLRVPLWIIRLPSLYIRRYNQEPAEFTQHSKHQAPAAPCRQHRFPDLRMRPSGRGRGMLQVTLWRCYLNAKYPHAAESIGPLIAQYERERKKQRSHAEAEAAAVRAQHCRCPECPNNPQCVFSSGHSCVLEKYV